MEDDPLYYNYIAHAYCMEHAGSARRLCNKGKVFAISGTNRKVNLDIYVFERPTNVVDEQELYYQLNDLVKRVTYQLPGYGYGDILQTTMDEEVKTMKVLSKKFSHIVDYYDFILLHRDDRNPIIITNQILNHILSKVWELVDAHTIVVPLLQEVSWLNFLEQAIHLDLWEEYMGY